MKKWDGRAILQNILVSIFLACGIISIGLTDIVQTKEPAHLKSRIKQEPTPPASLTSTPWLERASKLAGLTEILQITNGVQERKMLNSMIEDELEEGSPFANLSSHYPLVIVLSKGIKTFRRATYRSNNFRGEAGYDLVTYAVVHPDGTHSEIMAYLEGTQNEVTEDALGKKSTYVLFSVYESSLTSNYNLYKNNELSSHGSIALAEAVAMVTQRVSASVPLMAVSARE